MNLFGWLGAKPSHGRGVSVSSATASVIKKDWESIEVLLSGKQPSQLRQALITADKSLDAALKDLIPGETMGERLKNAKDKFSDYSVYQDLWEAHKMRNSLVHEAGYEPPHYMITDSVEKLRKGLLTLGVSV